MRILSSFAAAAAALFGMAQAANIPVANGDFEAAHALGSTAAGYGSWDLSAADWNVDGVAGTWEHPDSLFPGAPASVGNRLGFVNAGGSLSQSLGVTIESGVDYTLSALFGHRTDIGAYAGSFGFFVGNPADAMFVGTLMSVADPGAGLFSLQSMTVTAAELRDYIGQQLGIVFIGEDGQVQFDNVEVVMAFGEVVENPLPGAVWLFGSALVAGGFFKRRKKKTA